MKKDELLSLRISELIVNTLKKDQVIQFNQETESVRKTIEHLIRNNFQQEKQLEEEAYQMMEDLEQQGHDFERHKMYPLLKKELAKKKGFIL